MPQLSRGGAPVEPLRHLVPRLYVTGGRQRPSHLLTRDEWSAYEKAVLLELDTDSGAVRTVLGYESPRDRTPDLPSHVFKAASWDGDHLLLCTQTEVLVFDPRQERIVETISHPWFNDLHHVARIDGRLHVVSTGLDAVLVMDGDQVADLHSTTGEDPWQRFDRGRDYRRVATTKPHRCHPNYVFTLDGVPYASRFQQRDALPLGDAPPIPRLHDDPIHDGVVAAGRLWFTVVSGHVVAVDPATRQITERYDLDRIGDERGHPLGWCRGYHRDGDVTYLAFSRLRPTKLKQNLAWLRKPLGKAPEPRPARVTAYQLEAGRKLASHDLEEHGIASIFSVLPATPPAP